MKTKIALSLFLALCWTVSGAVFTPLALPTLTEDITTWTDGSAYASLYPNGSRTFAGVPFEFQSDASRNNIFYGGTLGNPIAATLSIPVNIYGVTAAYTLINTAWGSDASVVGSVTFLGSGGISHTVELVVGLNVRDHFYGGCVNTTTDPMTTQAVFGDPSPDHAHFDMQTFALPAAFQTATLEYIFFASTGVGATSGKPFLAAATVAVPDSGSTLALLGFAAALVLAVRRRGAVQDESQLLAPARHGR